MPDIPKGHKVIDTVKDNKGFYRIIQRPDGTKYSQTLKLFTEQDNDRKVRGENKSLGQYSTTNIKGNMANAMALTAVGGGAAALALHNATQGRQDKVGRKVRGAAFGSTRPQGAGLKTPAGTAGDVRGRVSPNRPPAIVRSVDSFNQRGSTMPQTGNLFDQPEPPSGKNKAPGRRYAPAGTAKVTGKGKRGVPRPNPRVIGKSSGPAPKPPVTQARPTPLNPNTGPGRPTPLRPIDGPRPFVDARYYATDPLKSLSQPYSGTASARGTLASDYFTNSNRMINALGRGPGNPNRIYGAQYTRADGSVHELRQKPLMGEKSMLRPSPLGPDAPTDAAKKSGTRYAPAGTAKATGKGTRGVPRPSPRSNFKPATGSKPTGGTSLSGQRTALRPTPLAPTRVPNSPEGPMTGQRTALRPTPMNPNYRPGPVGQLPNGPLNPVPGPLGRTQFPASKPPKPSLFGRIKGFAKASVPAAIATHMLEDAGAGVMSAAKGDWKGAGQRGLDLLSHTKFGGLIPVADQAMKGFTGKGFRDNATSVGDKIIHAKYIDGKQPAPVAKTTTSGASGGNKPAGGQKPYEPRYFPEAGGNGNAVRKPDSYLGEAFDYSLQKGTTSGSKYLEHMFRRDKVSEDDQQRLRERFNKKVVGDKTLKEYGADKGITQTLEGKKSGLGEALLGKYRDTGTYKGNTDYDVMRAAAEARMARK